MCIKPRHRPACRRLARSRQRDAVKPGPLPERFATKTAAQWALRTKRKETGHGLNPTGMARYPRYQPKVAAHPDPIIAVLGEPRTGEEFQKSIKRPCERALFPPRWSDETWLPLPRRRHAWAERRTAVGTAIGI